MNQTNKIGRPSQYEQYAMYRNMLRMSHSQAMKACFPKDLFPSRCCRRTWYNFKAKYENKTKKGNYERYAEYRNKYKLHSHDKAIEQVFRRGISKRTSFRFKARYDEELYFEHFDCEDLISHLL